MNKLARLAVCLVCLAACGSSDSNNQPDVVDAGRTEADAATTPDPSLPGLRGTVIDRYLTESGEQQLARDLTMGFDMEVLVEQADGTYATYPVTGDANGIFAAPEVPDNVPIIVRYGSNYLYTSERRLYYGTVFGRRANAVQANDQTRIALNVDGLVSSSQFEMMFLGPQNQFWQFARLNSASSDPTILTASFDYRSTAYLVDGSQGDSFYILQVKSTPLVGNSTYGTIVSIATPEPFTMNAGQTTNITTTARSVAQDQSFALEWQQETYAAAIADMFPPGMAVLFDAGAFYLFAVPVNAANGASTIATVELVAMLLANLPDVTSTLVYGDPFPQTWERSAVLLFIASALYPDPGGNQVEIESSYVMSVPLNELTPGPMALPLSKVRNPLIDGMDALMPLQDVSLQPTVSWDPPDMGVPSSYNVVILRLENQAASQVALLRTADAQVKIPPGVLEAGKRYVMDIRAVLEPGAPLTRPFNQPLKSTVISRITSTIDTVAP